MSPSKQQTQNMFLPSRVCRALESPRRLLNQSPAVHGTTGVCCDSAKVQHGRPAPNLLVGAHDSSFCCRPGGLLGQEVFAAYAFNAAPEIFRER